MEDGSSLGIRDTRATGLCQEADETHGPQPCLHLTTISYPAQCCDDASDSAKTSNSRYDPFNIKQS
jgi:hypothetical protein